MLAWVLAVVVCLTVRMCVCVSHAGIVSKWLYGSSWFLWHTGFPWPMLCCVL